MPGFVLTSSSTVQCMHGGSGTAVPSNTQVMADGSPVLLESDTHIVAGCPFSTAAGPMPCVTIAWSAGATKLKINGTAALLQSSVGQCKNAAGAVQGMALVVNTQTKVSAQ